MFEKILEAVKEVKLWSEKEIIKIVFVAVITAALYFFIWDAIETKKELKGLKEAHFEELKIIRLENEKELREQRKKFQEEIDSYVLKNNQERERATIEFNKKLEQNENEIYKLRKEIKSIKNEISK